MPRSKKVSAPLVSHYFVDEAGDSTLFDKRGHVIIQTAGCSRFFILGSLQVKDADGLDRALSDLRKQVTQDSYFRGIPSIETKTTLAFHAKDDIPEVRMEVFRVLREQGDLRFFAVVRDKQSVLKEVQTRNARDPSDRYNPNDLYDKMVSRLFRDHLHKPDECHIAFAKRGRSDRSSALRRALEIAQSRAEAKFGLTSVTRVNVREAEPSTIGALQAADYLLWALQRLYERREERYIQYVWPLCHLVHDIDDQRINRYGVYYTQKSPIELGKLKEL